MVYGRPLGGADLNKSFCILDSAMARYYILLLVKLMLYVHILLSVNIVLSADVQMSHLAARSVFYLCVTEPLLKIYA